MYFSVSKSFEGKILQVLKAHRLFFYKIKFRKKDRISMMLTCYLLDLADKRSALTSDGM